MTEPVIEFTDGQEAQPVMTSLPFAPLTISQVMHCSYHSWYPRYRGLTPKTRMIALTKPFIEYLRADGIILPPDEDARPDWSDDDSGIFSSAENTDGNDDNETDEDEDPSAQWPEIHESIKTTISELDGKVAPKLNWSAPKDATWISATNSMECRTPNDIYLLLKSSDFVTHDLETIFDGCVVDGGDGTILTKDQQREEQSKIPYHLILRKSFQMNPSLEFRVFVRNRQIIGICQRDLNHFDFLFNLQGRLLLRIQTFFEEKIRDTFEDENFTFDVYIPPPHERVWLIDFNPWAIRTDPLLFSWKELLTMPGPEEFRASTPTRLKIIPEKQVKLQVDDQPQKSPETISHTKNEDQSAMATEKQAQSPSNLDKSPSEDKNPKETSTSTEKTEDSPKSERSSSSSSSSSSEESSFSSEEQEEEEIDTFTPEFRLIRRDDPEAYGFATPQYSAHKLPRDVVDASRGGEGQLREFAEQWKEVVERRRREEEEEEEDGTEEEDD